MEGSTVLKEPDSLGVSLYVNEGNTEYTEIDIQKIWEKFFNKDKVFKSLSGSEIRILFPGERNLFCGPDFKNAVVEINGVQFRGDIEIHMEMRDWYKHGHHLDANYDRVILHIVFEAKNNGSIKTSRGTQVETVVIRDLPKISQNTVSVSLKRPPCLDQLYFDFPSIIRMLAQERLLRRVESIRGRMKVVNINQVLYEQIFWALGAGTRFADLYLQLAKKVTYPLALEISRVKPDLLEKVYLEELEYLNDVVKGKFCNCNRIVDQIPDTLFGVSGNEMVYERLHYTSGYPPSHPSVRVAFMSSLISSMKDSLVDSILHTFKACLKSPKPWLKWQEFFLFASSCETCSLTLNGGKYDKINRRKSLIGKDKIITILGNVIIPFVFYCYFDGILGESENKLWELYFTLPGECENWILRKMKTIREIIIPNRPLKFFEQQGLIQWYRHNCESHPNCEGCQWGLPPFI